MKNRLLKIFRLNTDRLYFGILHCGEFKFLLDHTRPIRVSIEDTSNTPLRGPKRVCESFHDTDNEEIRLKLQIENKEETE